MKRLENAEQKHSNECCFNLVEVVMSAFSIHFNGYNIWKKFSSQLLCLNPLPKVQDFYKNGFSLWENRFSQKKPTM